MANAVQIQIGNGNAMPIRDTDAQSSIATIKTVLGEDLDEKVFTVAPNMYNKTNAGIKPGYYASGSGWKSAEGDARLGTTHPLYLYKDKTYKFRSAQSIYGGNAGIAWRLNYPGNGDVVDMSNVGTYSDGFYTVTINSDGWYVVNIDMTSKDSFMFCFADMYPDAYIAFGEPATVLDFEEAQRQAENAYDKLLSISPNLFNKNSSNIQSTRFVNGTAWASAGDNPRLGATHPIYCVAGVIYKFLGYANVYGSNSYGVWRVDPQTMSILSRTDGTYESGTSFVTWTCPANGYYVVNTNKLFYDTFIFCISSKYPNGYYEYYGLGRMAEDCPNVFLTYDNDGTPQHKNIATMSPNMFNVNSSEINTTRYGTQSGWISAGDNPRLGATHPIYFENGKSYKWMAYRGIYGEVNTKTAFGLNDEGNIVDISQVGEYSDDTKQYVILNCTRSGYYVINTNKQNMSTLMICETSKFPSVYMAYGRLYANDGMDYSYINVDVYPLANKILVCDGDSIAAATPDDPQGLGGWFGRLKLNEHIDGTNYAIGGGTITYLSDSRHCISRDIDTIHNTYTDLDYLILEGGTNDADLIGQFDGDTPPQGFGTWAENDFSGSYDDTTFCGAVESMFYKAVNYWAHAHIGFIIAMEMGTNLESLTNRKRYFDEIVKIAKKWHIPVLNLWDNSGADARLTAFYDSSMTIEENVAAHKFYRDGQHPSSYGYNKMQPMIEAWVKSL